MSNDSIYGYDDAERPRGILTESDREYLLTRGEGYSRQAGHARQQAIQERFTSAVLDLALLADLPAEERRELLLEQTDDEDTLQRSRETARAAVAFFYQIAGDLDVDFEHLLEEAIVQAEQTTDGSGKLIFRTADVTITPPEIFDIDQVTAMEKGSSAAELTRQELLMLIVINYKITDRSLDSSLEDVAESILEYWADNKMIEPFPERGIDRSEE